MSDHPDLFDWITTCNRQIFSTRQSSDVMVQISRIGANVWRPHNFLGKAVGTEDYAMNLDVFELVAKRLGNMA